MAQILEVAGVDFVVIDNVTRATGDHDEAADQVYQKVGARVMEGFLPLYERSSGACGYVTMQGDPREDEDTPVAVGTTLRYRELGKDFMAKIPVIAGGLEAIEVCVEEDIPVCATEVFAIAQAISICELYQRAAARAGNHRPFYVTHITGIFDEYLGKVAKRDGIDIDPAVLAQAGCAVARKQYRMLKERAYETTMLGGGARGTHHFTEMVGGDAHVTINWSTARELIDAGGPAVSRMDVETLASVINELCDKFADFRKAYYEDELSVEEYAGYGPVQLFRNAFLKGWYLLLVEIASRRHAHAL
jgi:transaldolase